MADTHTIRAVGLLKDVEFHMVKGAAQQLHQKEPDVFFEPDIVGLVESEWIGFIEAKKKELAGEMWGFKENVIVFVDNEVIGGKDAFMKWAEANYDFRDYRPLPLWYAMAKESYKNFLINTKHKFVYMDIGIGGKNAGRLLIELFTERCPKTCDNFCGLCKGNQVESERHDPPLKLSYAESIFHRIVPNGWIQGGDIEGGKGIGGESIYGPLFEDEDFSVPHNKRGIVGMANKGRHTNSSQFYITLQPAPWMDTKYVAFGQVIEGVDVLDQLEEQETFNERPRIACSVLKCGLLDVENLWNTSK